MTVETAAKEKGQVEHSKSPDSRPREPHAQQLSHVVDKKKVPPPSPKHVLEKVKRNA